MTNNSLPTPTASAAPATALPTAVAALLGRLRLSAVFSPVMLPWLGVGAIGLLLAGWLLLRAPDRAPIYSQLPEADKAAVVAALEDAGMAVALDPRSGAVLLPPADHARARMMLAAAGLPRAAPGAGDLLADMPLGTSRALEGARLKTAQERELARSIELLEGVQGAVVLIARPEASAFVRDRAPVTAAVTLTLAPGRALSDGQARAIVHLVAGAVPDLAPDRVAIVDQAGRLLSGDPSGGATRLLDQRLQMQAHMETRATEAVLALLAPVVGRENISAQVAIDVDFAQRDELREQFDRDGALRSEATSRRSASEPRAIGIPGALSNTVPAAPTITATPPPAAAAPPPASADSEESATRNYELGRSIAVTSRHGGQIRRLTAAVAIRAEALGPPAGRARMLAEIQTLVEGAVGYDAARGDRIAVAARSFAPPASIEVPLWQEPVVAESAKWLATALVAIALLLLVVRPLLKRLPLPARLPATPGLAGQMGPAGLPGISPAMLADYGAKLAEARLLAATDAARATAVARRLLSEPAPALIATTTTSDSPA